MILIHEESNAVFIQTEEEDAFMSNLIKNGTINGVRRQRQNALIDGEYYTAIFIMDNSMSAAYNGAAVRSAWSGRTKTAYKGGSR